MHCGHRLQPFHGMSSRVYCISIVEADGACFCFTTLLNAATPSSLHCVKYHIGGYLVLTHLQLSIIAAVAQDRLWTSVHCLS